MRSEFVHGPIYGSLRISTMRYIRPTRWVGDISTEPAPAIYECPDRGASSSLLSTISSG